MKQLMFEPESRFVFSSPWITAPGAAAVRNCVYRLVRSVTLETVPAEVALRITADTRYLLFINGQRVGGGPVRGTVGVNYFDTWEIAPLLRVGRNVFAVLAAAQQCENFLVASAAPAVRIEAPGIVAGDTEWRAQLAPDWRPVEWEYTMQTGFMEWRKLAAEPDGWLDGACAGWDAAVVADAPALVTRRLAPRNVPALRCTEIRPVDLRFAAAVPPGFETEPSGIATRINDEIHESPEAGRLEHPAALTDAAEIESMIVHPDAAGKGMALVFDFGDEWIGELEIVLDAPAGTVAEITYGEEPWHGRVRAHFTGHKYYFTDRYDLKAGENVLGTLLGERGFRLVQLTLRNFAAPVTIRRMRAVDRRYPYSRRGDFFSSDPELNAIYRVCVHTLESCTTDVFLDCPWRERAFWVNDLVVENRTSLAAFGASAVHKRAFELAFSQQRADGLIPGVCPAPIDASGMPGVVLVPTNMFIILMLKEYALYSGDSATVRTYLPAVVRILDEFERWVDTEGLATVPESVWNFYDWSFELNGYSFGGQRESMINSLYVFGLKLMLELAHDTGFALDEADYQRRIDRTAKAVIAHFYRPEKRRLVDPVRFRDQPGAELSSQLAHSFALMAGVAPEELRVDFEAALTDETLLRPDFYLHRFLFLALQAAGNAGEALRRIRKHWGNAVASGHPTLYEAGIHQFGREAFWDCGSLCHGFGTAPIEFFESVVLGVTPLEPGFKRFRVAPQLFDLEFAGGRVATPHGNIRVHWQRNRGGATLELDVPAGCEAVLPNTRVYGFGSHHITLLF